jgi:hypothetical protein
MATHRASQDFEREITQIYDFNGIKVGTRTFSRLAAAQGGSRLCHCWASSAGCVIPAKLLFPYIPFRIRSHFQFQQRRIFGQACLASL